MHLEYASLQKTVQHMVVFGAGFVGGPLAVTLAFHNPGIRFTVVDSDRRRVDQWSSPFLDLPIREPGLDKLITDVRGRSRQQLQFCSHIAPDVLFKAQMIILCLPCPLQSSTTQVKSTIETLRGIIRHAGPGTIIAQKSTVPLGFGAAFQELMLSDNRSDLTYLSAPEFLSETCALDDLTSPSRLLIGIPSPATKHVMAARTYVALHLSFLPATTPIIFVSVPTAELAKLTANTLLATRLTVVNTVAALADRTPGAEVGDISRIVGLDPRIGGEYLRAGPGIGGSCLLENVEMLAGGAQEAGLGEEAELLGCVSEVARRRPRQWAETMLRRLESILSGEYEREARLAGQKIVVLGYAFKANSADVRNTPAKGVVEVFLERSLDVLVWDPLVSAADKALATEAFAAYARRVGCGGSVAFVEDVRRACRGALAVLQVVGHSEITTLDRLGGVTGHERIIRLG